MKAIEFPQQHGIVAKDQPEYIPLPAHYKIEPVKFKDADGNEVVKDTIMELTACFQLEPEEIAQVIATGKIWYTQCVWGQNMQPIRMSVLSPFEETTVLGIGWQEAIRKKVKDFFNGIAEQDLVNEAKRALIEELNASLYFNQTVPTQAAPEQSTITRQFEALKNDTEYR